MNFLTDSGLDRMPGMRNGKADFSDLVRSGEVRFLIVKGSENLLRNSDATSPRFLGLKELGTFSPDEESCFLLGEREGVRYFTIDGDSSGHSIPVPEDGTFTGLRKSRLDVKNWTGALIAYSNALIAWHRNHRFCGKCGSPTMAAELGQARYCSNSHCAVPHYPRTDPAIIVAVTRGDKCLMGRKEGWPEGMFSLVAGYVDHGESLEDSVVREVYEETGIRVRSVSYHSSQPWPFPYTLMLGYFAEAENEDITVDYDELEEARWFSRDDIVRGLAEGTHRLPTPFSISRKLITEWFESDGERKLAECLPGKDS